MLKLHNLLINKIWPNHSLKQTRQHLYHHIFSKWTFHDKTKTSVLFCKVRFLGFFVYCKEIWETKSHQLLYFFFRISQKITTRRPANAATTPTTTNGKKVAEGETIEGHIQIQMKTTAEYLLYITIIFNKDIKTTTTSDSNIKWFIFNIIIILIMILSWNEYL